MPSSHSPHVHLFKKVINSSKTRLLSHHPTGCGTKQETECQSIQKLETSLYLKVVTIEIDKSQKLLGIFGPLGDNFD